MWYKSKTFWLVVIGAFGSIIAYFNEELAAGFKAVCEALLRLFLTVALVAATCVQVPACAGAIPAIATAVAVADTVGELVDLFTTQIDPEYQVAHAHCAQTIADLAEGDPNIQELNSACSQLTDAYYNVQALVEQFKAEKADRSAPLDAEADRALLYWDQSKARYNHAIARSGGG